MTHVIFCCLCWRVCVRGSPPKGTSKTISQFTAPAGDLLSLWSSHHQLRGKTVTVLSLSELLCVCFNRLLCVCVRACALVEERPGCATGLDRERRAVVCPAGWLGSHLRSVWSIQETLQHGPGQLISKNYISMSITTLVAPHLTRAAMISQCNRLRQQHQFVGRHVVLL